jgi:hypothetical protein
VLAGRPRPTAGPLCHAQAIEAVDAPTGQTSERPAWRAVALPSEHGGWGLTAEPIVLGLLLAPSAAGLCLGAATMLVFLLRTPLRVTLVDHHRRRTLARTRLAHRILVAEAALLGGLVGVAAMTTSHAFWWPVAAAAPLVGVELWFDTRSRSRRLVPELTGAVGVSAAAAVIVLAGGHGSGEAVAAWLVLAARSTTAIPHVRDQVARLHRRTTSPRTLVVADVGALGLAALGVAVDTAFLAGGAAIVVVIVAQRVVDRTPAPAKVLGIRQSVLGALVVTATALGVHVA